MSPSRTWFLPFTIIALLVSPAFADWNPGDPYKMHFPQLPDPTGWDVAYTNVQALGDDWECIQSGPVSDIHLWVSFRNDLLPSPAGIVTGSVQIWNDVPPEVGGFPYSHPGQPLWSMSIDTTMPNVKMRLYDEGPQGWLDPLGQTIAPPNHFLTYQINIKPIPGFEGNAPFIQQQGQIYWLVTQLSVIDPAGPAPVEIGWKTSLTQFRDDAVYAFPPTAPGWQPLTDPFTDQSLDLAFVITPEPATLTLLGLGALMILRRHPTVSQ